MNIVCHAKSNVQRSVLYTSHVYLITRKGEGAISNTPTKSNTYACLLIMYLKNTLKRPNVCGAKHGRSWMKSEVVLENGEFSFG